MTFLGKFQAGVTVSGGGEDFALQAARGDIAGVFRYTVFGLNGDMDTQSAPEDLWSQGGDVNYPAAASVMNISSSSAQDGVAGTGVRSVIVQGLDANFDPIEETVTMNGTTPVTTTQEFRRINRIASVASGSGNDADGLIYVYTGTATGGVPDDASLIYRTIPVGDTSSEAVSFTVPRNMEAFIYTIATQIRAGSSGNYVDMQLRTRRLLDTPTTLKADPVFRARRIWVVTRESPYEKELPLPFKVEEASDMKIRGVSGNGNNLIVAGTMDFLLVQKRITAGPVDPVGA